MVGSCVTAILGKWDSSILVLLLHDMGDLLIIATRTRSFHSYPQSRPGRYEVFEFDMTPPVALVQRQVSRNQMVYG